MNTLQQLVIFNGIYDILCALCLLKIISIPILNKIHLSMFINEPTDQDKRYMVYWIFTYGCIRILWLIHLNNYLVIISYLIEAIVMINECVIHKQIYIYNGIIVSIISFIIAIFIFIEERK